MTVSEAATMLRLVRKDRNISQTDIAAQIPCAQSTVSQFERGLLPKHFDFLVAYADALEVELPDELRRLVEVAR